MLESRSNYNYNDTNDENNDGKEENRSGDVITCI